MFLPGFVADLASCMGTPRGQDKRDVTRNDK